MKRAFLALTVALLLLLVAGVGTAAANPPAGQSSGQWAGSQEDAGAAAGTAQWEPSNENSPAREHGPGDGSVSQSNEASSEATAVNANETEQDAEQGPPPCVAPGVVGPDAKTCYQPYPMPSPRDECSEVVRLAGTECFQPHPMPSPSDECPGSCTPGGGGSQVAGQSADNEQDATAIAGTVQVEPSNDNVSVRVLSPGDEGSVSQSNEASSEATAVNANLTGQHADQTQAGDSCKCGSAGDQVIGQSADNDQDATAVAETKQEKPSNSNISVRVLSPGDDGDVWQSNEASSKAEAGNINLTGQHADQTQAGDSCKCGSAGDQVIGQSADNDQDATAVAETKQEKPSNSNISVRVLSPGDDGDVWQSNEASSKAEAGNINLTGQHADQTQAGDSCKCGSAGDQVIGQSADNDQDATAVAETKQEKPSNSNISVRVLSPGDDGDVWQSNEASSKAEAGNINLTGQHADQTQAGDSCKCGSGLQVIGQSADSKQEAAAIAATIQEKPSNSNTPIRVLSKGDDGDVWQSNEASSKAEAGNLNLAEQKADQEQAGGSGLQVIGQEAKNDQDAFALGLTIQKGAKNENEPLRVLSKGDDGDVWQSNEASSKAEAGNINLTGQHADQTQAGDSCKCGSGLQVIGQSADSKQEAAAIAATIQEKPSNSNTPIRVLSKGDDGDVWQSNEASSKAEAGNLNLAEQKADQEQAGGSGLQVIGQEAKNDQGAFALGLTIQKGAKNENEPLRVLSKGDDGDVWQSNEASSKAEAGNINLTGQHADQTQAGDSCKCGSGLQVIGQSADSKQEAAAIAATIQEKPSNSNTPIRVLSKGDDGDVWQSNEASSKAEAGNLNLAEQKADQEQAGGSGLQVIGQEAKNDQARSRSDSRSRKEQRTRTSPCVC